MTEATY